MAFGMYMSPSDPNELGSADNPLLFVLGGVVLTALSALALAVLAPVVRAGGAWRHRLFALAAAAGGLIVLTFVAGVGSVLLGF
jgi:hypothetical protein